MATDGVIFYPGPTWFISHVLKPNADETYGLWGMISPPGGSFSWGGTAYSIPVGAQNPELAWHAIRWLTLSQAGAESFFSAHATPSLYAPAYATDLFHDNPDSFFAGQDVTAKLLEIAMHPATRSRPMSTFDPILGGGSGAVWEAMIDQGLTAEEAMTMFEDEAMLIDNRLHR
jgi:multiple sugar transport system substrate-binding protein